MTLTDVHVHLAAFPTDDNGCRLSTRMRESFLVRQLASRQGIPMDDPERANRLYLENLAQELSLSRRVSRAALLALDGVYDARGELDQARTEFLMSNDAVFKAVRTSPRLLAGVSINPARKDALAELERCAELGAVLVKVLPNVQMFDPAGKRHIPFYRAMARLGLPLLCHVGYEFSLIGQDQSVGDPARLVNALEEGVTVVAAHGCSFGVFLYEKYFPTMSRLVGRYPNFFMDTSALTLPNRVGALLRLRRRPEVFDRLIFGTDYPLPCLAYPALAGLSLGAYRRARAATNRFDRQVMVLESLGLPAGRDFLELVKRKPLDLSGDGSKAS